jgi:hypothetical protein
VPGEQVVNVPEAFATRNSSIVWGTVRQAPRVSRYDHIKQERMPGLRIHIEKSCSREESKEGARGQNHAPLPLSVNHVRWRSPLHGLSTWNPLPSAQQGNFVDLHFSPTSTSTCRTKTVVPRVPHTHSSTIWTLAPIAHQKKAETRLIAFTPLFVLHTSEQRFHTRSTTRSNAGHIGGALSRRSRSRRRGAETMRGN